MSDSIEEDVDVTKGYLLIDTKKCQGCMTCMLTCSLVHEGEANLMLSRIQVVQNAFKAYPLDVASDPVQTCDFCTDTPFWDNEKEPLACVALCPLGAVRFSKKPPRQTKEGHYRINFRGKGWKKIGYSTE